jgi:hypothetical protein
LEACEDRTLPSTVTWIGGSGDWDTAANWSTHVVPGPGDDVVIEPAGITVTHAQSSYDAVHSLTLGALHRGNTFLLSAGTVALVDAAFHRNNVAVSGTGTLVIAGTATSQGNFMFANNATISGAGALTIERTMDWGGGILDATLNVAAGATVTLTGAQNRILRGTLNNAGTVTWTGTANIGVSASSQINNLEGGLFDIQNDQMFYFRNDDGFAPHPFNNAGTLRKSAGDGETSFDTYGTLNNTGTVDLETGALGLLGGGDNTGVFQLASDGVLDIAGSNYTFDDGTAFTGPGTLSLNLGTLTVSAPVTVPGDFQLLAGTLRGTGVLTVEGDSTWAGGMITGNLTIPAGGTLTISGVVNMTLKGTLTNAGTVIWDSPGDLNMSSRGAIDNQAGGLFDIQNDQAINFHADDGSAPYVFTNAGTLLKSAGDGVTQIADFALFTNTGTVEVDTGTLVFGDYFTNYAGTTLTGGTFLLSGTLEIPNADIQTNAATVVLDGPDGQIIDQSGANALASFATNTANGSFTLQNGAALTTMANFANQGVVVIGDGSTFQAIPVAVGAPAYTQTDGSTTLAGGTLIAEPLVDIEGGIFAGFGTIQGGVRNAAQLQVGSDGTPGLLTVIGPYIQTADGTLIIQIGGPTAGDGFDQLNIIGQATLDGTLDVTLINNYTPNPGDPFQVVTFSSGTGEFSAITGDGPLFDAQYGTDGVTLVKT